jgi:membrane-associated protease RseP (regulator of RpoE activity)
MKRIKFGMGGILMIAAMLISDRAVIIGVYMLAAALHEMGHLLAARLMKIEIKEISFGFSGVRIVTDARLTSYKREILLAFAGPFVNIAIFCAVCIAFKACGMTFEDVFGSGAQLLSGNIGISELSGFLALSSLVQAIMNLLPVKSFDGGRIIYCAIADKLGQSAAERVIDISSALSAVILWALALYLMLRISAGLGIFVFSACIFASAWQKEQECS